MKNISIIYWSGTGNTEQMARLIEQGLTETGESPILKTVSDASLDDVKDSDLLVLGSPSMGTEVIEESEMEPFVEALKDIVAGKTVALFGSYGWGSGEWMIDWEERMRSYGASVINDGLIVNGSPDGSEADRCVQFGKSLIIV